MNDLKARVAVHLRRQAERLQDSAEEWWQRLSPYRHLFAVASFALGLGSFLLLERGKAVAQWLPLFLLAGWLLILGERTIGAVIETRFGKRIPADAFRFVLQGIHQESFFFALPFVWGSTVWASGHTAFTSLVLAGAAISVIDPIYYRHLAAHRSVLIVYHTFALFVSLLVAVPLVFKVDSTWSLAIAATVSALVAFPSFFGVRELRTLPGVLSFVLLAVGVGALGWTTRRWIPPAPLRLMDAAITDQVASERKLPTARMVEIEQHRLHRGGLAAFTAVRAPLGLRDKIFHVWVHRGKVVDRIPLRINGGRKQGYRTWSRKAGFPADAVGRWRVEVRTDHGQLIGLVRFRVI